MDPNDPVFSAKQILIQYKDAAKSKQTRSKDEAKKRADEALGKLKGGAKFEDVVKDYSDEEGAAQRGGLLGRFKRGVLPPAAQAALEKTEVGKNTDVVESELGFHILLRVQ
jgi:parvulin-like peptidyl-prolyl isomerase